MSDEGKKFFNIGTCSSGYIPGIAGVVVDDLNPGMGLHFSDLPPLLRSSEKKPKKHSPHSWPDVGHSLESRLKTFFYSFPKFRENHGDQGPML